MAEPTSGNGESGSWTKFQIAIAIMMVSTGSVNTLAAKWADKMVAKGVEFDHPFLQAVCMFIGEFLCLLVYLVVHAFRLWQYRRRNGFTDIDLGPLDDGRPTIPSFNPFTMFPAAFCDMLATSIMYVGLNLTFASSFQMLRGSVIVFTGLLSMFFLKAILRPFRWLGMFTVLCGLVVVGLADIVFGNPGTQKTSDILLGDGLIIVAQVIVACQMVYEQKWVMRYDLPPLLAVGLEGLFGMITLSLLIIPMHWIVVPSQFSKNPGGILEDVPFAFQQMAEQPLIIVALSGTILSIAFFNFAGISVTKELSATTRMVLDSVRTLVIWVVSLALSWQQFVWLTVVGFVILVLGMFIYNDLILGPAIRRWLNRLERNGRNCGLCLRFWGGTSDDLTTLVDNEEPIAGADGSNSADA